jgi:type 1 glutamine amidotransferase
MSMSMHRFTLPALLLGFAGCLISANAADTTPPIKAIYLTGGGYHDYSALTPLLTKGMAKYANVTFTVVQGIDTMKDATFGDGADIIVYNMCYADQDLDMPTIEHGKALIEGGKPAIMVHCAMHCFRKGDQWSECCGLLTKSHDGYKGFTISKASPEHPIAAFLPEQWKTAGDELYQNLKFPDTSIAVLTAYSVDSKKDHVVAWVHTMGKGRVFGTTLGHDMKTAAQPEYSHLLANGILWATGHLTKDGKPEAGYEGTGE